MVLIKTESMQEFWVVAVPEELNWIQTITFWAFKNILVIIFSL